MQSRASRVARGWVAGTIATGVAAVSHGLANGSAPSALAIVVGLVFAGLLGTLAVGKRPSLPRLSIVVGGSQLAFHLLFSGLTPGTATVGTHHTGAVLDAAVAHHGTDPWMWAAHTVALLATIAFLRRAEVRVWNILDEAFRVTRFARVAIANRPAIVRLVPSDAPRHPFAVLFFCVVTRRGPPALGFAS